MFTVTSLTDFIVISVIYIFPRLYVRFQAKIYTLFPFERSHDKLIQNVVSKVTTGCIRERFRFCAHSSCGSYPGLHPRGRSPKYESLSADSGEGKSFVFFSSLSWYSNLNYVNVSFTFEENPQCSFLGNRCSSRRIMTNWGSRNSRRRRPPPKKAR